MQTLPEILFAQKDAAAVEREIIAGHEAASGRTLARGDPVRLFLESIAAVIIQQRNLIDFTGKQNLLYYSREGFLEHLGALLAVYRIPAAAARTTLRFTLSTTRPGASIIPAGTRATPGGGDATFALVESVTIPAGELIGEGVAECITPGEIGNGYLSGQIKRLVNPLPWVQSVENITTTAGGADTENDDSLRERIQIAPEKFSVAGPTGAYRFWALSAHQDIVDVAVLSPTPGEVNIHPLLIGGLVPPQEIMDLVFEMVSSDSVRPLTDLVRVLPPALVEYPLEVTWWLLESEATSASAVEPAVNEAVSRWVEWQRAAIGRDLNPSRLVAEIVRAGAKRVEVISPLFRKLEAWEVASPSSVSVVFGGFEDE